MEQYIVSARKYRPDSFTSLIGQDNIVQTLKNSIKRGQLAHAYLFCGPRGVGKTSLARIFAKTINCEHPGEDMEPCGECESCVSFAEGRSYCIHELDAASNNGVDDIKALMDQVQIPPQIGKYSVYIIDEVHMLSQAAFNAFLKTLEEPPAHAIFILATTEKHKILPTILSRCQTYDFNRIGIPDIVKNLRDIATKEGIKIDDESMHVIAGKADGAMRDALTIFDQTVAFCGTDIHYEDVLRNLGVLDYENCFDLVEYFLTGDYPSALIKFDELLSKGFNALHFVGALSSHLRDLIVAKSDGLDALLELPESLKAKYKEQASRCSLQFLYEALSTTTACESAYKGALNPRLHIEFTLMKLSFIQQKLSSQKDAPAQTARTPQSAAAPVAAPSQVAAPAPAPAPAPRPQEEKVSAPASQAPPSAQQPKPEAQAAAKPAAPAPEAPAKAPERKPKKASALSMSAIMDDTEEKAPVSKDVSEDPIPDDALIMEVWKEFPAIHASRPRLSTVLKTAKTEISEKDGVKNLTFFVMNELQKKWLEEQILHSLENDMRKRLNTGKFRLFVSVSEEPEEQKQAVPYTPKEKAQALISENEQVRSLVKDFNLDV